MSSAEILQDYLDQLPSEDRQQHLLSIRKNTRRMAELMEEVLLLARFDAGKMEFKPSPVEVRSFCQKLAKEALAAVNHTNPIQLKIGDVPDLAQADERLLEPIFGNLLNNAIKYSEPGMPVEWAIEQDGRDWVSVILDGGIGIPEDDLKWLFQAYHRGQNVGQRPGTGLGLVVVRRCVERHGGQIQVESQLGHGTTVTVRLPVFAPTSAAVS